MGNWLIVVFVLLAY